MLFWASPAGDEFQGLTANLNGDHITNFNASVKLDLTDLASATAHLTYTQGIGAGLLVVSDGTHTATITLPGTFIPAGFHVSMDGHGGTFVSYAPH
jgi:hypothetical protein